MNNTTQLLAVLAEYPHLSASVYKAIRTIAFIEREWGVCPPIAKIGIHDDTDLHSMKIKWDWARGAVYIDWEFEMTANQTVIEVVVYNTNMPGNKILLSDPKPPQVAKLLAKYITHIAEYAWDYR